MLREDFLLALVYRHMQCYTHTDTHTHIHTHTHRHKYTYTHICNHAIGTIYEGKGQICTFRNFLRNQESFLQSYNVGSYAQSFRKMYGKISKNFDFFFTKMLFFWLQINFETPFLAWWFHLVSYTNVIWEFLRF